MGGGFLVAHLMLTRLDSGADRYSGDHWGEFVVWKISSGINNRKTLAVPPNPFGNPKTQKPKNPKTQKPKNRKNRAESLWIAPQYEPIFGFLDFRGTPMGQGAKKVGTQINWGAPPLFEY